VGKLLFKFCSSIMFYTLLLTVSFADTFPIYCIQSGATTGGAIGVQDGYMLKIFILINFLIFGMTNLLIGIHRFVKRKKIASILFFVCALLFLILPFSAIYVGLHHLYLDCKLSQ